MAFASPLALLGLLAVPAALGVLLAASRRRARTGVLFTNLAVLEDVVPAGPRRLRRWAPPALVLLALATAAAATAQPRLNLPVAVDNTTIVLLVDVSGSMSARDVEPTRLDAAVAAMRVFVDRLPKRFKVGLVQFSDSSQVLAPPTADRGQVDELLGLLEADSGTAIGTGLVTAIRLVKGSLAREGVVRSPGEQLPAAIVLLSDGKQNQGRVAPLAAAAQARAAGIPIDTVALGTRHGVLGYGPFARHVAPAPQLMHAIALATGGRTASATDPRQLAAFYGGLRDSIGRIIEPRNIASWFAAAAAVLVLAAVGLARAWEGPLAS
jgi:Ca-activated chloride channel homolog